MAQVTVNVTANTTQATAGIDNLNSSLNTAEQSSDELANSLSKQEARIKTLDGAVNLVGGSIEVLAGSLALAGAVTEEQAQKFQAAAVGAIALADGSKRMLEGYKTLASETKVLTVIQKAYNTVLRANPIGLVITAILSLAAAYLILKDRTTAAEKAAKSSRDQRLLAIETADALASAEIRLARAQGASEEDLKRFEILALERQRDKLTLQRQELQNEGGISKGVIKNAKEITALGLQQKEVKLQLVAAELELSNIITQANQDEIDAKNELRNQNTLYSEEIITLKGKEIALNAELRNDYTLTANLQGSLAKQTTEVLAAEEEKRAALSKTVEEQKQVLLTQGVDNIQGALSALFGESKAVASANVLIDAAQAGVGIIKNSQTTGPLAIAYQATQFALLGATTIASLRQINSAEPGSTSTPNTPRSGGVPTTGGITGGFSGPGFNLGAPQLGGNSGVTTISAVVLAGDVTSAQAQNDAIRNRRRFG